MEGLVKKEELPIDLNTDPKEVINKEKFDEVIEIEDPIKEELNKNLEEYDKYTASAVHYLRIIANINELSPAQKYIMFKEFGIEVEEETYAKITIRKAYKVLVEKGMLSKPHYGVYIPNPLLWNDKIRHSESIAINIIGTRVIIEG